MASPPDTGHAYRTAAKYNDYATVRTLGRTETGVGRQESEYAARALEGRYQRSGKRKAKSRSRGR